jgi:hypothetical protein
LEALACQPTGIHFLLPHELPLLYMARQDLGYSKTAACREAANMQRKLTRLAIGSEHDSLPSPYYIPDFKQILALQMILYAFGEMARLPPLYIPPSFIHQIPCNQFFWHVSLSVDMLGNVQALNHGYGKRICPDWAAS